MLPLVIVSGLLVNWIFLSQAVYAAPLAPTAQGGHLTFQQFLAESQKSTASHGAFAFPAGKQDKTKAALAVTNQTKPLPSTEPPSMKPLSLTLTSTPAATPLVKSASVQPIDLKGSDGRLEVLVPADAFDLSKATTIQGKAASGPFTLTVTHLHGNFIGQVNMLGSYQFQVLDSSSQPVRGVVLLLPITLIYHYQVKELRALQLDPDHLYVSWPEALATARKAKASTQGLIVPMTNNIKQRTLTAQMSMMPMGSTSTGSSSPIDGSPPKPNFASVQGNSGNLGYSYPLQMAPGPDGLTPPLQFSYSTAVPNSQHGQDQPAGNEGEGWSIGLGSITSSQINGTTSYSMNGIDGVSDMLIPIPGQSGFYETEHISHLRIQISGGCFYVWDSSGNYYQLGCTSDSLQYYTNSLGRTNYRWDMNEEILANEGPNTPAKQIIAHYGQDGVTSNGYYSIRDSTLLQVQYGLKSANGQTFTVAGTVDFLYRAAGNSGSTNGLGELWETAYGTNYQCSSPPENTSVRCDDPITYNSPGPIPPPTVFSTMMLQKVETFVGDDSSNSHLDASYALNYTSTPFGLCVDWATQISKYCAGSLVLNSITPTVYLQGIGHQLHLVNFGYTAPSQLVNDYVDTTQTQSGGTAFYSAGTGWPYLNSYYDGSTGVGEQISYAGAWNNTHGTPNTTNSQGQVTDDRHDPLYCTIHSTIYQTDCSGAYANPNDRAWTVQVVTQIQNWGKDSSNSALQAATTTYNYQLAITGTGCPAAGTDTDCVGATWLPPGDNNWQSYYDSQFMGFSAVYTTSSSGNLTVDHYSSNHGWGSATTDPTNYLSDNLLDEEVYSGNSTTGPLLEQTINTYGGESGTNSAISCDTSVTGTYIPCESVLLSTQKTMYEGTSSSNSATPSLMNLYTYDDYNPSASGTGLETGSGHYHNLTQDQVESRSVQSHLCAQSCPPPTYVFSTVLTRKWTYQANDQTVNGWTYYDVNKATESEIDDPSAHIWACTATKYDEGAASGVPVPAQGLATTVTTYNSANCASQTSPLTTTYTGYDGSGQTVAAVDALGAANANLYSGHGCTLVVAPTIMSGSWSGGHYTGCTTYDSLDAQPLQTTNAFEQTGSATYDASQQDLPVRSTDLNGQVTTAVYRYDSNGNATNQMKLPLETGSYTNQSITYSTCSSSIPSSTTLPCLEKEQNSSLYSNAVSRTFYDGQGRQVESRIPGPTPGNDTVVLTVYNDQSNSIWKSVPFQVTADKLADGSGWIDPNGAKDINGVAPAGSVSFMDALGRTIAAQDPNYGSAQEPGIACSATLSGTYTSCVNYSVGQVIGDSSLNDVATSVDPNKHVSAAFTDALGRTTYDQIDGGVYGGTLTLMKQEAITYNVLNKPQTVVVTDEQPQGWQGVTSVTTSMTYDDLGRMLMTTDPDQGTFAASYDQDGHVLALTQTSGSNSRTVGSNYDLLGRLVCEQTAAGVISWNGACSAGSPLLQNTYDTTVLGTQGTTDFPIGRLTQSVATTYYPDSTSATVTQQVQTDQRGRTTNTQMQLGLPSSWNVTAGLPAYQLAVSYNDANQVTTTSATAGSATSSFTAVYDGTNGSLQGLGSGSIATSSLASLAYNEYAQLSGITLLNGTSTQIVSEQYSYDGNQRPTSLTTNWLPGSGKSGEILGSARTYDNASNVTSTNTFFASVPGQSGSGGSETQNFCYDEQNRLLWSGNGGTQPGAGTGTCGSGTLSSGLVGGGYTAPFLYTNLGQIWQGPVNGKGATEQYLYCNSAPHQLTGIYPTGTTCATKGSATAVYSASYDPWGNETGRTYNSVTATLSYDTLNRMTEYNAGSAGQEFYLYDASGNRVLKRSISGGSTKLTAYAFGLQELSYTGNGALTSQTDYYAIAGHLIGSTNGTATTYDLTDAEGSVLTSLSTSAVLGEQIYGPYGNQRYAQGTMGTDKGYTGQFQDAVSGLDYYNARYYDPVMGQFLSADNVQGNAQGMDPYAYVAGNPETATDPTGQHISCPPDCGTDGGGTPCTYLDAGCGPTAGGGDCNDACGGGGGPHPTPPSKPTKPRQSCKAGFSFDGSSCLGNPGWLCAGMTYAQCSNAKQDAKAKGEKNASDVATIDAPSYFEALGTAFGILAGLIAALAYILGLAAAAPGMEWLEVFSAIAWGASIALGILSYNSFHIGTMFSDEGKKNLSWFTKSQLESQSNDMHNFAGGVFLAMAGLSAVGNVLARFPSLTPKGGAISVFGYSFAITGLLGTTFISSGIDYYTGKQEEQIFNDPQPSVSLT